MGERLEDIGKVSSGSCRLIIVDQGTIHARSQSQNERTLASYADPESTPRSHVKLATLTPHRLNIDRRISRIPLPNTITYSVLRVVCQWHCLSNPLKSPRRCHYMNSFLGPPLGAENTVVMNERPEARMHAAHSRAIKFSTKKIRYSICRADNL